MDRMRLPIIVAIGIVLVLLIVTVVLLVSKQSIQNGMLEVAFLDVGQGDAIFIESPAGIQMLIDGGKGRSVLGELHSVMGFFDRDIDVVMATHADADHIGGLIDVLARYRVHTIVITENVSDTPAFRAFHEYVEREGAAIVYARRGHVFDLGEGKAGSTTLTVLFPDRDPQLLETNTASIVSQLVYGETEYLFTGDAPDEIEEYLVSLGTSTLASDVLKVGHHGSRTSSSESFLAAVHPTYAIISAGRDNSYGHPHQEVTDRLSSESIEQISTQTEGTIFSYSDGTNIIFK